MAMLIGFALVSLLGFFHHFCLRGLEWLTGDERRRPNLSVLVAVIGLLTVDTSEILLNAGAYRVLLGWPWIGELAGSFDGSWNGLVYFSGINFVTLGYTQIEAVGPIRLVSMMQSLGGFMVLTWSATFIYSAWGRIYRKL